MASVDFENKEYLKLKVTGNDKYGDLINGILVPGESIIQTYDSVRDGVVFTNKRIIAINVQGITGKKKSLTILPYKRVQAFAVETAGVIDMDSELDLWFSGLGHVRFEFTSRSNVAGICRGISECALD